jgi:hypothetical protein
MRTRSFIIASCIITAISSCGGSGKTTDKDSTAPKKDTIKKAAPAIQFDRKFNDYARFMAGLPALPGSSLSGMDSVASYKKTVDQFNTRWKEMDKTRLSLMRDWAKKELYPKVDENLNTFYPFSGPDFLNAYQFFPNSKKYLFLANEMVGRVPDFDKMSVNQRSGYYQNIFGALRDIFYRSYFITQYMGSDIPKVQGTIPIFMVFLARTGNEVLNVEHITVDSSGNIVKTEAGSKAMPSGVRITFRPEGKADDIRTLEYFNYDITNVGVNQKSGLRAKPGFVKYLKAYGKCNSFLKAASYCPHYESFSDIKDITVQLSQALLQDDTGVPWKFLKDDFNPFLYGQYVKPIANFKGSGYFQPELATLYKDSTKVKPLPFSLGYHFQDNKQNYMLFVRK